MALLISSDLALWALLATATVGNVAGSALNWLIGLGAGRFQNRSWFPVSQDGLDRARAWYHRYGRWSLLMSWVPVIGGSAHGRSRADARAAMVVSDHCFRREIHPLRGARRRHTEFRLKLEPFIVKRR